MSEALIREQAQNLRLLEAQRIELRQSVRDARAAGATIKDLMAWTRYSKRNIQYMLKENER